jgi:hypothetical protein
MDLRFQLPAEVLPLKVDRARLVAKINALSRRVTIAGRADGRLVELHRVSSPLGPIRLDITRERFLSLDKEGGLHLNLSISDSQRRGRTRKGTAQQHEKWKIEYLELEVSGETSP